MFFSSRRVLVSIAAASCLAGCQSANPSHGPAQSAFTAETVGERAAAMLAANERGAAGNLLKTATAVRTAQQVVAGNIANAETTAYKATVPVSSADGQRLSLQLSMEQGSMESTNRPLDVAIEGQGFFRVKVMDSSGDGVAYTRNGNLFVNREGRLVVGVGDGYRLIPPISFPADATSIDIRRDGTIECVRPGQTARTVVGQFQLVRFLNPSGLKYASGMLMETPESGPPIACKPGENGAGSILQSFLEGSNVDLQREQFHMKRLKAWQDAVEEALTTLAGGSQRER